MTNTVHKPKPITDADGKPRFDTKKYLEETVRMADHTTRDVMFMATARKANIKQLRELAEAYKHAANRLNRLADDFVEQVKHGREAATASEEPTT